LVFLYPGKAKGEKNTINAVVTHISYYDPVDNILNDPGGELSGSSTKNQKADEYNKVAIMTPKNTAIIC